MKASVEEREKFWVMLALSLGRSLAWLVVAIDDFKRRRPERKEASSLLAMGSLLEDGSGGRSERKEVVFGFPPPLFFDMREKGPGMRRKTALKLLPANLGPE